MSMSTGERLLTIHCAGPEAIEAVPPVAHKATQVGIALHFATLAAHRDRIPSYRMLLDPVELERAARFRFEVDRERFIIAHGLLRTLLGERLGASPEELRFGRGPYGKPFIEGSDLRFNLSDTKDALVIAIGSCGEIGVDVETMTRAVDHLAVSEHYFTQEEITSIRKATGDPTISSGTVGPPGRLLGATHENPTKRRFLEYWTRKEAVLKASGVGIMDDLRVLRVDGAVNTMTITHGAFVQHAAEQYHLHTWHLGEDHILSVAQEEPIDGVLLIRH